jgi:hypothetical protein
MTEPAAAVLLVEVRRALRSAGLSQPEDHTRLVDVETWIEGGAVVLQITTAPDESPHAAALPGRVRTALAENGLTLAPCHGSGPNRPPTRALAAGEAVAIIRT